MARTAIFAALVVGVVGFSGCMHEPKMVQMTSTGGVVAIPEDSNAWPYHYRDAAYAKIREKYPSFDPTSDIVSQSLVPVGVQTTSTQFNNTQMTTASNKTEFQIAWRVNPALIKNGPLNNPVVTAGGLPRDFSGQQRQVGGPASPLPPPNQPGAYPGGTPNYGTGAMGSPIYQQGNNTPMQNNYPPMQNSYGPGLGAQTGGYGNR
jgi:hypothetical protein